MRRFDSALHPHPHASKTPGELGYRPRTARGNRGEERQEEMAERWFLKCRSCKEPWAINVTDEQPAAGYEYHVRSIQLRDATYGPCPSCGDIPTRGDLLQGKRHKVMGKVARNRLINFMFASPCDGRCTNARGPNCDCQCGGKNHGGQRVVEMQIDTGPVPDVTQEARR